MENDKNMNGLSINYQEMAFRTEKEKVTKNPDGHGQRTGNCGDTIEMFLSIRHDCIQSVTFLIDGCINTRACSNAVAFLTEGKSTAEAWKITPEVIIDFLECLPSEENHCAELAVGAFYLALSNYHDAKRSPWKKLY
jgi:nitrogen fixation NifU-like protein